MNFNVQNESKQQERRTNNNNKRPCRMLKYSFG